MTTQPIIEKGIPIPEHRTNKKTSVLHIMEIGDSIVTPSISLTSNASFIAKKHSKKFAVRKQDDGTYRIWRTA